MISVIIPTYNREDVLPMAIDSVLNQTYRDFELIIVDDCSTDRTEALVKEYSDERIRYYKTEQNGGAAAARNMGVSVACGEWIAFEDSDDYWHPDKLEKQMQYAENHPEYDLIYSGYIGYHNGKPVIAVPDKTNCKELEGDLFPHIVLYNRIGAPTVLVRINAFREIGGFDTTYNTIEDWDFVARFCQKFKVGYVDEVLLDAEIHRGGVSDQWAAFFECRCRMMKTFRKELEESGLLMEYIGLLFQRAETLRVLEPVKSMVMSYLQ